MHGSMHHITAEHNPISFFTAWRNAHCTVEYWCCFRCCSSDAFPFMWSVSEINKKCCFQNAPWIVCLIHGYRCVSLYLNNISFHAWKIGRAAMDEMMGDQVCTYCDCRGQCWCCVKDKRVRARYPGRDECLLKCPIISWNSVIVMWWVAYE